MAAAVVDATIAELVVAAQAGSHAAFTTLYGRFHRAVHAVALARVGPADAADVVQDVFARAWTRLDSVRDPAAFAGWLMTMARNRAIDRARSRAPERLAVNDSGRFTPASSSSPWTRSPPCSRSTASP